MRKKNDRFRTVLNSESPASSPLIIIGFGLLIMILFYSIGTLRKHYLDMGLAIGAFIALTAYVVSTWKVVLRLTRQELILERHLIGKVFSKHYDIKKIKHLKYARNVKSDSYTSVGHIKVMGVDQTPESWKTYYYHAEVLSFTYDGKSVKFGEYQSAFHGQILYKHLSKTLEDESGIE